MAPKARGLALKLPQREAGAAWAERNPGADITSHRVAPDEPIEQQQQQQVF